MISNGMKDAGYQYVNLDDCWQTSRDADGNIVADATRFPSGIKALADYIHSKGLKFGLYSDAGVLTCAKRPGSIGHEYQDALQYAKWGVDYLKEDWCSTLPGQSAESSYTLMRDALADAEKKTGHPILFSLCEWGSNKPWLWAGPIGKYMAVHRRHPGLLGLQEGLGRQWCGCRSSISSIPSIPTRVPATGTILTCSK